MDGTNMSMELYFSQPILFSGTNFIAVCLILCDCVVLNRITGLSSYEEPIVLWNSLMAELKILSHFTLVLIFPNINLALLFSPHLLAGLPIGRSPRYFPINLTLNCVCLCVPARPTCRSVLGYVVQTILAELPNEPLSSPLEEIINWSLWYFILLTPII
jgi:hypothetical protein